MKKIWKRIKELNLDQKVVLGIVVVVIGTLLWAIFTQSGSFRTAKSVSSPATGTTSQQNTAVTYSLKNLTMYFSNTNEQNMYKEVHQIVLGSTDSVEQKVFNELLIGPKEKVPMVAPIIPPGAKLLSIKTDAAGLCTVDLSHEFIDNQSTNPAREKVTLISIVNSLTELPNVKKVQFLIDGKPRDMYKTIKLSAPFEKFPLNINS